MSIASRSINFLIYLNEIDLSESIKKDILKFYPNSQIYCVSDFDQFINYINKNPVDCFIIDLNLVGVSADDIVQKLRRSKKFHKTVISFFGESNTGITKEQFSSIGINFIINNRVSSKQFENDLSISLTKYFQKTIPENFNVLVLDDSADIRDIITQNLKEMGHEKIQLCSSVKSAIDLISNNDFDLLLLDWNLPDGSCIDLIENIRLHTNSSRTQNAIVIVITGRNDVDDIMTLLKYKVIDHIIKPFDFSEFEEKIMYAIERRNKKK